MKIELTIKADYLADWGMYEGVRELIQNAKDAETEMSAKMTVRHRKEALPDGSPSGVLVIENEGCSLPHEALLFGHTTKSDRTDTIGKFGEGLKLGVLALVRAGHNVRIRSGSEVWVPAIVQSEKFKAKVLAITIETGRAAKSRVQVEVDGISEDQYEELRRNFLFLLPSNEDQVTTNYGSLLLGVTYVGKLFVKGIYIQSMPKLRFGYDLTRDVNVDRDRKIVYAWDLNWRIREIWRLALAKRPDLMADFQTLLESDSADVSAMDASSAMQFSEEVRQAVAASFRALCGENAVPVENLAECLDLEHLGKKGVLVNKAQLAMLQSVFGRPEQIAESLRNETVTSYSFSELDQGEKSHLREAMEILVGSEPDLGFTFSDIDVVSFRSPTLRGQFRDGRVLVARTELGSVVSTLAILIHEMAHKDGADGEKGHVARIEQLWRLVATSLLRLAAIPRNRT